MECMGRTVVDFYVCLVVGMEAGEWHLEKKAIVRSRCLNFRRWAIRNLRETCGFPVSLWALKGVKWRVTFLLGFAFCLFVCVFWPRYPLYTEQSLLTSLLCLGKSIRNHKASVPWVPLPSLYQIPTDASVSFLPSVVSHQPNCTSPLTRSFAPIHCYSSEQESNALCIFSEEIIPPPA